MKHAEKCRRFEDLVRGWAIPYVAVNEAKRALFGATRLTTFDFILYADHGPNLLVDLRNRTPENEAGLRKWQEVFGDDFKAVFCRLAADGPILTGLDGLRIEWSAITNKEASHGTGPVLAAV